MTNTKPNEKPGFYTFELTDQLATAIQNYEDDREEYWKSKKVGMDWDTQKGIIAHADKLANLLLEDSKKLISQESYPSKATTFQEELMAYHKKIHDEISAFKKILKQKFQGRKPPNTIMQWLNKLVLDGEIPEEDSLLKLVWERIFIDLARYTVEEKLIIGTNRLLQLVEVIVKVEPPESTLRFLRRISRCFIWGFDSECIILCRGAIDTAFAETINDEMCDKNNLKRANYGHTLANRIKAAYIEGIIDERIKDVAYRVNTPATEAAHKNPDAITDVLKIIKDTLLVIEHLAKHQKTR
jgi:hypothetical protein